MIIGSTAISNWFPDFKRESEEVRPVQRLTTYYE